MLDWVAGGLELICGWKLGNKSKTAFIFGGLCCVCWITHVALTGESPGLLVVVVPSLFINVRNYRKWSVEEKEKDDE